MPVTSAPSERSFSSLGAVVTRSRNRLLPQTASMLTFIKHNSAELDKTGDEVRKTGRGVGKFE